MHSGSVERAPCLRSAPELVCCLSHSLPPIFICLQLTALQARAEGDLASLHADAAATAQRCAELQAEQAALASAKAALAEQLAARDAAVEEMGATMTALKEDCARLDELNCELREAMVTKARRGPNAGAAGLEAPSSSDLSLLVNTPAAYLLRLVPLQVAELERKVATLSDERAQLEREADQMQRDMQELARQLEVQVRASRGG